MNKQELIAIVAEENELSKAQAGRIVDSVFDAIVKAATTLPKFTAGAAFKAAVASKKKCCKR